MESEPLDLREYLSILWRRKGSIFAIAATTTAAALAYSFSQTPVYTSSAEVIVLPTSFAPSVSSSAFIPVNMSTEQQVANSLQVARLASTTLRSQNESQGTISVAPVVDTQTLVFTSESPDAGSAQATAQAYAEAYLQVRRIDVLDELDGVRRPYESQIEGIDDQLEKLTVALKSAEEGERELLTAQYTALLTQRVSAVSKLNDLVHPESVVVGRILRSADLPESPSAPSHTRDGALEVIVGLAIGMGVAFLRDRLDEPVRGRGELELRAGAPVLGFIPSAGWERSMRTRGEPTLEAAEAFKALRVRLLHVASQRGVKSVVITSCFAEEGKTSVTANLGIALALAGKRVVIVSTDLRRPRMETYFPDSGGDGLTELLKLRRQPKKLWSPTDVKNLRVLHAGRAIGSVDPSELLGSESMSRLLSTLCDFSDFVLIDTPPLLTTPDVVSLAPLTDGVLLVVDPHLAQQAAVDQARHELQLSEISVLGVVVNKHDSSQFRAYAAGGYSYYGDGRPSSGEDHKQGAEAEPERALRAIPAESQTGVASPREKDAGGPGDQGTGDPSRP
jgi:capsular exopolysaccharide synthesis family protein